MGPVQVVIGFGLRPAQDGDDQQGLVDQVEEVLRDKNVTGFTTYGEQFGGVHLNQTLTGIAIGQPAVTDPSFPAPLGHAAWLPSSPG